MGSSQRFAVGDVVSWTSQSGGFTTTKRGEVVEVVPAGSRPSWLSRNPSPGMSRNHESYIVKVAKRGLYWPRVSSLKKETTDGH